jgi:hypothetical protein
MLTEYMAYAPLHNKFDMAALCLQCCCWQWLCEHTRSAAVNSGGYNRG